MRTCTRVPQRDRRASVVHWLGPLAALLAGVAALYFIGRELTHLHLREIAASLRAIPNAALLAAAAMTLASYCLLSIYDSLALRYVGRRVPYRRVLFTSFIANAFGHNLGFAAFTSAATRLRLYAPFGLTALEIATVSGFCSLTIGLGLAMLVGMGLLGAPDDAAALHLNSLASVALASIALTAVAAYIVWASVWRAPLTIRGWTLRAPGPQLTIAQLATAAMDLSLSAVVLWLLLPAGSNVHFGVLLSAYAVAVTAGLLSHVPGGLGVFEAVIVLALPNVPTSALLGSLLAYRGIYYLGPLLVSVLLFARNELNTQSARLSRARSAVATYVAPMAAQVTGALCFIAGAVLLVSGATSGLDSRLAVARQLLPDAVLEISHLAGSVIGVALVILARALFRRVHAAYHLAFWLLVAGIAASLLKGLDFEEAALLALVLSVLALGRPAFYRPASILAERFTPGWIASVIGVIGAALWIGFIANRHVEYSHDLWWMFGTHADAPRMLRASLLVVVFAAAWLLLNLLRPVRPAPVTSTTEDLEQAQGMVAHCDHSIANAVLAGDKRLLFSAARDAFIMYQVAGRSWVALGDPVGPSARARELVWQFRELSDLHGGRTIFYQVSAANLPRYLDLGLAALKIGEEAHVPLASFSLEGSSRAELRQAHRRAMRDGATFEIVPRAQTAALLPDLRRISDSWLAEKGAGEKRFSVGAFSEDYVRRFDIALVRRDGVPVAFANLWATETKTELSIDLMRFAPSAPRGAMDFLFAELLLWGAAQGFARFNLGMAPLAGLERRPLAPAWHKVGGFVFRHGEHFYNFEGLRRYKCKFHPDWMPKYLVTPGGVWLPSVLIDISVLISGGVRRLVTK